MCIFLISLIKLITPVLKKLSSDFEFSKKMSIITTLVNPGSLNAILIKGDLINVRFSTLKI
jgi:hypothetical protein